MTEEKKSPLQFPCSFVIKIVGAATDQFEQEVLTIVKKHVSNLSENALQNRFSKDKKYLALTITITADSQEHLDALYRELSANPHVLMAL